MTTTNAELSKIFLAMPLTLTPLLAKEATRLRTSASAIIRVALDEYLTGDALLRLIADRLNGRNAVEESDDTQRVGYAIGEDQLKTLRRLESLTMIPHTAIAKLIIQAYLHKGATQ